MEEALPSSEQHSACLLIFRLRLYKTHLRALWCNDDYFSIGSIVFLPFDKGPHILRCDQLHWWPNLTILGPSSSRCRLLPSQPRQAAGLP